MRISMRPVFLCTLLLATAGALADDAGPPASAQATSRDGRHDFDFEFGDWTMRLSRRMKPLTGSNTWVQYEGSSIVRKVWNGAANLGEIELDGPGGHIEGLTLRVYNPDAKQWNVHFANSASGVLGEAMVGGFRDGRGEFYDQETYDGRAIFVRFVFSDITPTSFKFEQAFSADGGKTWEANWVSTFTRVESKSPPAT
jgi:hypothetical protein